MSKRLYVGNLAFHSTEDSVRGAFQRVGIEALGVQLMTDRMTGQSRGFGFVDVAGDNEVRTAIQALHGKDLDGRALTVNEAREHVRGELGADRQRRGHPSRIAPIAAAWNARERRVCPLAARIVPR